MIPQSMTHKILARRAGKAFVRTGEFLQVGIDMAFTHDPVLESLRDLFYREFGAEARVWDPDRVALFQDHFVPAKDARSRALARAMDLFAAEQSIHHYYPYGADYGICHVAMCENGHVQPGTVVVGTDSHSVAYGAFNAFGTGVGLWDMACLFRTGDLWFRVPEVVGIRIDGALTAGVLAKDMILRVIGELGAGGASGRTMEFYGTTIDALSAEERLTLCSMVVEAGAKNGIMALNDSARAYLERVSHHAYEPVATDEEFEYHTQLTYRAGDFEPVVAYPHSPDNVHPISAAKLERIRPRQVYVGSCTGGKLSDINVVANVLRGKRVAPGVELVVVPASMAVYRQMAATSLIRDLLAAGAVIESPGCKACYGAQGAILGDGEICLSTTNRNFRGRMGNPKSLIYLASPYIAARSALAGYITD